MPSSSTRYHRGDLRAACLRAAVELLEGDGAAGLSVRAVARRAGVSPGAPYRHYADRDALVSAVAAEGYRELAGYLSAAHPSPSTPDDLAAVAVAYVQFALEHPALFRTMFSDPCDGDSSERVAATTAIAEYVGELVRCAFPGADPTPCRRPSRPWFTAWPSCTSMASSTPLRRRRSPTMCMRPYLPWSPCPQRPDADRRRRPPSDG
jgi:AcrR family transcriptional regulator